MSHLGTPAQDQNHDWASAGRDDPIGILSGPAGTRHKLVRLHHTHVGHVVVVDGDRSVDGTLLADGIYEPQESAILNTLLAPGMHVIDVGANFGYFSLLASRHVLPVGIVHAFEPEPTNYQILERNIRENGAENVRPWPCAMSSKVGCETLYVSETNLGRHSFSSANTPNVGAAIEIKTRTLDEFVGEEIGDEPDILVKVDAEGAEGAVLRGGARLLAREGVTVWFEFWPRGLQNLGTDPLDLLRWLDGFGFRVAVYDDVLLAPVSMASLYDKLGQATHEHVRYLLLDRDAARLVAAAESASLVKPINRAF